MTRTTEGRSLELYFIEGRPDGMLTAEVFNWTGHVLMTPRTRIGAALARKEARYTGVYILLGERDGEPRAYIGEGENISGRIRNHDTEKDWWTSAVLVTTGANALNKAHVKYLEARLVEEARESGRVTLDNGNTPPCPGLSEAAQSNMEAFLGYLLMVLPALRVDMFIKNIRPKANQAKSERTSDAPRFVLENRKRGLKAYATLEDGDFIVEAGSQANVAWDGANTKHSGYAVLHEDLQRTGVLKNEGDHLVFTENYAFKSPSAAAGVVNGRPSNGTLEWKLADGSMNYKAWEASKLTELAAGQE
ncbi:methionine sulfoxide reductase [Methylosinus sp. R-45379]|uniref:GIY-YIG nuclease family protein n=1 Tax=Methylosinus sp. R-45379 TaxID=980563 RepID=UPI0007C92D3A|nr:GIY-YIG nuclease family protein [Methylosinus sp. R-45379]OAI31473.1 methionine sulfoxide reductase [Methylosinus sp. R-45379]